MLGGNLGSLLYGEGSLLYGDISLINNNKYISPVYIFIKISALSARSRGPSGAIELPLIEKSFESSSSLTL